MEKYVLFCLVLARAHSYYPLCPSCIDPYGTKAERASKALTADANQKSSSEAAVNASSTAYPCTNPHCCRIFLSKKNLRNHLRSNDCQSGIQSFRKSTTHMPTDRVTNKMDFIKRHVADSLSKTTIPCRGGTASTDGTNYDGKVSDHIDDYSHNYMINITSLWIVDTTWWIAVSHCNCTTWLRCKNAQGSGGLVSQSKNLFGIFMWRHVVYVSVCSCVWPVPSRRNGPFQSEKKIRVSSSAPEQRRNTWNCMELLSDNKFMMSPDSVSQFFQSYVHW